jgi:endonuclease/exonuclease/phosphatase family metal-dependent hydrolase
MATNLRVATFNCENLFSRPKIFGESKDKATQLIGFVAQLEKELQKDVFDKAQIVALKKKLEGFATINDIRGNHSSAKGVKEWLGWVELTRDANSDIAVQNTARVIGDVNADIICLMEVESRVELQKFHDQLLLPLFLKPASHEGYKYILLIDGNDDRGIDVAVMSRFPILWLKSHIHERTDYLGNSVPTFSRDCLEVRVDIPGTKHLQLLINHLKSQASGSAADPQSDLRRKGQAQRVAELADQYNLNKDYLIIAGDLNDTPDSTAIAPLATKTGLHNVNLELPEAERGTFTFRGKEEQLDYLLISNALKAVTKQVNIERRGAFSTKRPHYDTVKDRRTQASDHGAVIVDFLL